MLIAKTRSIRPLSPRREGTRREDSTWGLRLSRGVRGGGRLLALSGVVAVVLIVIAWVGLGGDTPTSEDSGATINAFYDSHTAREFIASFVLAAAAPFLVIFAVSLALACGPPVAASRALWQYVLIAGGAIAGVAFAFTAVALRLTDAADQDVFSESGAPGAQRAFLGFLGRVQRRPRRDDARRRGVALRP